MNNKKRTFVTIVCSILFIMPSFLGVPLADGNLVLVPTPDSGQVNDEISTITDLNDDNIKTIITTELLLQAESDESDLSDSDEIQGHAIRTGDGNDDNNNSSIPAEHSGYVESDQSSSNVVAETTPIPQEQFLVENASEPVPSWPLIPGHSGFGNGTDSTGLLVDLETLPTGYVNSTIVDDASLPDDMNLTTAEDAFLNMPLNAIDTDEGTHTIVEQLDPLNGTLGIVTSNETTLTPIPDLTGPITFTNEPTDSELGGDTANGVYDESLTLIDPGIDSLVDSSLIQGVYETVVENHDENTAFTSETTTIEGSDLSSTDSVNTFASNTNSGSGVDDDNNSNYSSSGEDHDNDGQCSDNSVHDHGHDKHKDKHRDGSRGNGEISDDEHHADSEITHDNVSHEDSDHHNSEGSDDDRDHYDHEDEGENNHDDSDHDDHDDE